jgi:hypothetical protein
MTGTYRRSLSCFLIKLSKFVVQNRRGTCLGSPRAAKHKEAHDWTWWTIKHKIYSTAGELTEAYTSHMFATDKSTRSHDWTWVALNAKSHESPANLWFGQEIISALTHHHCPIGPPYSEKRNSSPPSPPLPGGIRDPSTWEFAPSGQPPRS